MRSSRRSHILKYSQNHKLQIYLYLQGMCMAPSREKLTRFHNIHFRAVSPQHRRCPVAPFSKPVLAPGLQTNVRIHPCCVAANTQAVISLQLPSAVLVQLYSSVAKKGCTNFALTEEAGMCWNVPEYAGMSQSVQ